MAQVIIEYEEYQRLLKFQKEEEEGLFKLALTELISIQGPIILKKTRLKLEIKNQQLTITRG